MVAEEERTEPQPGLRTKRLAWEAPSGRCMGIRLQGLHQAPGPRPAAPVRALPKRPSLTCTHCVLCSGLCSRH